MYKFIPLLFLSMPAFAQLDTTLTYHMKEVDNITWLTDSTTSWKTDTITYQSPGEIKFTKTKIAIDGYNTYTITKHEIHGNDDGWPGYHYYELSNGTTLTFIEKWVYWEWPVVNKKSKDVVFTID